MLEFEWDPTKAASNFSKHKVGFRDAATVFRDPLGISVYDPDHSKAEERYITIGTSASGRVLMVAHTERLGKTRIISARRLTRPEQQDYEEEIRRRRG